MTHATDSTANTSTIRLLQPIRRGEQQIETLTLRPPNALALRGLQMAPLSQLDAEQLARLLPRIAEEAITEDDAFALSAADLMRAGSVVLGFLFPQHQADLESLSK
jgi:hypothetical protein